MPGICPARCHTTGVASPSSEAACAAGPPRGEDYWELEVPAGRDPVTGRRRRVTRTSRGTKRDAERWATSVVSEVDRGRGGGSTATVGELLDRWLELGGRHLSPTTRRRYLGLIERHIEPALGSVALRRLDASHLDGLDNGLLDKSLAPATVRQVHAVLRRGLGQAVK